MSENAIQKAEKLLDTGSFAEIGAGSANVATGYGTVDGRLVYVYSQCGPVNLKQANKIEAVYTAALKMGAPVVGFLDSKGVVLNESTDVLDAYGKIFEKQTEAKGVIPQIAVIAGDCLGTAVFGAALSDFILMSEKDSNLALLGPNALCGAEGSDIRTDLVHTVCGDLDACILKARELISYLPSNNWEGLQRDNNDDLNRASLNTDKNIELMTSISDNNEFFELKGFCTKDLKFGLGRVNGRTVGMIYASGALTAEKCQRTLELVRFCDAFNIAVVTFTCTKGYANERVMQSSLIYNGAQMLSQLCYATVPRVNVIVGDTLTSTYLLMNSKQTGCDIVYSWEGANISVLPKEALEKMTDGKEISDDAAEKGYIDAVIKPEQTRKYIASALEMLSSKRVVKYSRKHLS